MEPDGSGMVIPLEMENDAGLIVRPIRHRARRWGLVLAGHDPLVQPAFGGARSQVDRRADGLDRTRYKQRYDDLDGCWMMTVDSSRCRQVES